MARGLDHIVHAVRDLDAAAELYRRLGFQVGARNRHPRTGARKITSSSCREPSSNCSRWRDTSGMAPHASRHFSFGAFNRDFLSAASRGCRCWCSKAHGAADAEHFAQRESATSRFTSSSARPSGRTARGQARVYASPLRQDPDAPDIGFFTCQQHYPENFWNPAFQVHANTATRRRRRCAGRARTRRAIASFLVGFHRRDKRTRADGGLVIATPRGDIEVMTPGQLSHRFGVARPRVSHGARLAALAVCGARDASWLQGAFRRPACRIYSAPRRQWSAARTRWVQSGIRDGGPLTGRPGPLHGPRREDELWSRSSPIPPSRSAPCASAMPCRWR